MVQKIRLSLMSYVNIKPLNILRIGRLQRVVVALTLLQKTESVKGWKKPSLRIRSLSLKKQNAISVKNLFLPAKKSRTPSNQE